MNQILLFIGLVIILCLTIKPVGKKLPFPTLLIFIALGMLLGVNGPAHIDFSDYALTETVCSTALLFIMFYGGFNTNIDRAKPVAVPAVLLSTLGVVITAGITGVFAHFALGFDWIDGLLLGSVVASTDAASVFSVLREHNLSLKGGTDSLLEVESAPTTPSPTCSPPCSPHSRPAATLTSPCCWPSRLSWAWAWALPSAGRRAA